MAVEVRNAELNFAETLRAVRQRCGLTQSGLAREAGYDHSYISRLESEDRMPTRDAVLNISYAMGLDGCEADELLMAAGFMPMQVESLLVDEPLVGEVLSLLRDKYLPCEAKEDLRASIGAVTKQARRAAGLTT